MELGNITQSAAPTINNGVCVSLDKDSVWTVTGRSYITALTLAEGAKVAAPGGQEAVRHRGRRGRGTEGWLLHRQDCTHCGVSGPSLSHSSSQNNERRGR